MSEPYVDFDTLLSWVRTQGLHCQDGKNQTHMSLMFGEVERRLSKLEACLKRLDARQDEDGSQHDEIDRLRFTLEQSDYEVQQLQSKLDSAVLEINHRGDEISELTAERDALSSRLGEWRRRADQARRDARQALDILERGDGDFDSLRTVRNRLYEIGKGLAVLVVENPLPTSAVVDQKHADQDTQAAPVVEKCPTCRHPAHWGLCTARSGGTAYACCCSMQPVVEKLEHRCGVNGFDQMRGDVCPACEEWHRKHTPTRLVQTPASEDQRFYPENEPAPFDWRHSSE